MPSRTLPLSKTKWTPWPRAGEPAGLVPPARWRRVHVLGRRSRLLSLRGDVLRRDNHTQNTERPCSAHCESIRNHGYPRLRISVAGNVSTRGSALTKPAQAEDQIRSGTREAGGLEGTSQRASRRGRQPRWGSAVQPEDHSEWGAERSTVTPNETGRSSS